MALLGVTRKLLWPIRNYLEGDWRDRLDKIIADYGEPLLKGFLSGPYRPLVPDDTSDLEAQLQNLSADELVAYLAGYQPPADAFDRDNTAQAFRAVVNGDPAGYGESAERLAVLGLHPALISELLQSLVTALRAGTPVPWSSVIAACRYVTSRGAEARELNSDGSHVQGWLDAMRDVIDLLAIGLEAKEPAAIPSDQDQLIRDLLIALLTHPDPRPDREQDHNPLDVAINSARGIALEALISYAIRRATRLELPIGQRLEPEVRAALERHVDPVSEQSPAVHAIYGLHYLQLVNLDNSWVLARETSISPSDPSLAAFWRAAWWSYLLRTPLFGDLYSILESHYRRAIESFSAPPTDGGRYFRDGRHRLAQSIVLAYAEGWEELDNRDGRLTLLLHVAPEDTLAVAFEFLGGDLKRRGVDADSSVRRRSLDYWEARAAHHEAQASITRELVPIWRWLPGIPLPLPSVADLLARTFAHATLGWEIDQTIEFLATAAEAYPRDATRLLAVLGAHASPQLRAAFHVGSTETILTAALHSGDQDAVEFARSFINDLADKGDTGFYHLLT